MVYVFILISAIGMAVAQLLLKKGMLIVGQLPRNFNELSPFFCKTFSNIYVISAFLVTIVVALLWIYCLSKVQLSIAYPFMALSYVLVVVMSAFLLNENVSITRWIGVIVICIGVFLASRT